MRVYASAEGMRMANEIEDDAAGDFKELQAALLSTDNVEQFLHELSLLAAGLFSGGLSCGLTIQPHGLPMTVACSDPVAARVDEVQYKLDDGPCLHAARDGHTVRIEDTARDNGGGKARWPEFQAQAAAQGIRSCLALPLHAEGRSIGAINLYARTASAFGRAEAKRAENFAAKASGALALAMRLESHALLIKQLRSSLASRTVIDQALGIIMARERCTQGHAFAIMRSASQNSNVKLRDIASTIVTSVTGEAPQPPPPFEDALTASKQDALPPPARKPPGRRARPRLRQCQPSRGQPSRGHCAPDPDGRPDPPARTGPPGTRRHWEIRPAADRRRSGREPAARTGCRRRAVARLNWPPLAGRYAPAR